MVEHQDQEELDLLSRFEQLKVWNQGGKRAPHKPLLLLYALARVQNGEERYAEWLEIEKTLHRLLDDFGPPRRSSPHYPFWRLQNDGLWEIPEAESLLAERKSRGYKRYGDIPIGLLRSHGARGGFPAELDRLLRARKDLVNKVAALLLTQHFPETAHDEILDAVGMPGVVEVPRRRRDPEFRRTILRNYEQCCAVCGYDGRLQHQLLGLEAAHVRWFSHGGPDAPDNGVALCSYHHKALDKGALGFDEKYNIIVSSHVFGQTGLDELLFRYIERPLRFPQPGAPRPSLDHIRWHREEVFLEPRRGPPT